MVCAEMMVDRTDRQAALKRLLFVTGPGGDVCREHSNAACPQMHDGTVSMSNQRARMVDG